MASERVTYTIDDVARLMGIGRAAAYALVKSRGFPCVQVGRRLVVPVAAFSQWLERQTFGGEAHATGAKHKTRVF